MENLDIYENIAKRTQGDIYIGVVGPVRTGKSTFIKRFMDLMVLPNVENSYIKDRVRDELPQSGTGRTITTTEPKFIPAEAVEVKLSDNIRFKVRMADCVGYMVEDAMGHMENDQPRMVNTPWQEERVPFTVAAETGTRKVIKDHSTIGIVVTTDGSIGEINREDYVPAEERVVQELAELKKPFVIILNTISPEKVEVIELQKDMEKKYGVPVIVANCAKMSNLLLNEILRKVLFQFPAAEIGFYLPGFIEGLPKEHRIKTSIVNGIRNWSEGFNTIKEVRDSITSLAEGEIIKDIIIKDMDLGLGSIRVEIEPVEGLFYQVISEITECDIKDDSEFFPLIRDLAIAKKSYDKLENAMAQVKDTGYGIVQPELSEMALEEPEIFKQGNKFGVRLKAKAPSLHIIKTNLATEVSPVVGSMKQSEDLIEYLMSEFENDPSKIWETNIFGKSLYDMVAEQMETKLTNVPNNIRFKVQNALEKVSNEDKEYMICILL